MSALLLSTCQQALFDQLALIKQDAGSLLADVDVHLITFQNIRANTDANSLDALVSESMATKGMCFTVGLPIAFGASSISSGRFAATFAGTPPPLGLHINPQVLFDATLEDSLKIEPLELLDELIPKLISRPRDAKGPQRFSLADVPFGTLTETSLGLMLPINLTFPILFKRSP